MIENWITIILSSAIVSAITSGLITYYIEKRKYSQEYWKITIGKRLETYDMIEKVLTYFQSTHFVDKHPCHLAFLNLDTFNSAQTEIATVSWKRNWISSRLYKKIIDLNRLLYDFDLSEENSETYNISKFGVKNYSKIAEIRDEMIKIMAEDYKDMPEVKSFFKSKIKG
ncbi:hypothetical protein RQM65_08080 [Pricia sp. S334]|uniref:DUF4760 domain-containing protein n=1 Tax=Pricia mediterranea TaxID=3076079 RepID=A0ABU3L4F3_9FLAO|nr:hypothetical protein [Pricia sp. S334]MDT7828619.1 hypothetical protein [Pricia sp. S334]